MGDGVGPDEPTQFAGVTEPETESVRAWGLDEFDNDDGLPTTRFTSGRITGAAVATSLVAAAAAGLLAWQHFRTNEDAPTPVSPTSSMVPALTMTAAPVAIPAPVPPPAPPAVTITTVIEKATTVVQAPAPAAAEEPAASSPALDDRFLNKLVAEGWNITNAAAMARNAHITCQLLRQGQSMDSIDGQLMSGATMTSAEASLFSSTAMSTYPNCP
jgi:hypothetical protein